MTSTHQRLLTAALVGVLALGPLVACSGSDDEPAAGDETTTTAASADDAVSDGAAGDEPTSSDPTAEPGGDGTDGDDGASSPGSPGDPTATTAPDDTQTTYLDDPDTTIEPGDAETLVGLSEAEAQDAAEAEGWTLRVARRDGEDLAVTEDFSPTRVNVAVADGTVVQILWLG